MSAIVPGTARRHAQIRSKLLLNFHFHLKAYFCSVMFTKCSATDNIFDFYSQQLCVNGFLKKLSFFLHAYDTWQYVVTRDN